MQELVKKNHDLGLLALRFALGLAFLAHGIAKWQNMDGTIAFFDKLGLPMFMAYVVATVETLCGAAMLLGLWTHIAGLLIMCVMVAAIILVRFKVGYLGGYELDLSFFLMAFAIVMTGPGKYTIKHMMKKPSNPPDAMSAKQ